MKFKPTQKQIAAQQAANFGLFETEAEAAARQARGKLVLQHEEPVAPAQVEVPMSERPEWARVKLVAAGVVSHLPHSPEYYLERLGASFGEEAGSLRKVVACDVWGECL